MGPSVDAGRYCRPTTIKIAAIINPTNDPVWVDSVAGLIARVRRPAKLAANASTNTIDTSRPAGIAAANAGLNPVCSH
jgi:hypothetical protein